MSLKSEILTILQNAPQTVRRTGTNADWPGGAHNFNIFSITGGPVRVTAIIGHVRVACTANVLVPLLSYYPLVTGIGAITAIATIAVGAIWPVDTLLEWQGTLLGVLAPTVGLGHGQASSAGVPAPSWVGYIDALPGFFQIVNATADATAQIDWYCTYIKLAAASQLAAV